MAQTAANVMLGRMFALKVQCDLPEDAIDAAPMPHSIQPLDLNERVITHEAFLYAGHQQPQALLSLALCSAGDQLPQAFLYAGNQQLQAHHLSTLKATGLACRR